jgi:hypothetical protein
MMNSTSRSSTLGIFSFLPIEVFEPEADAVALAVGFLLTTVVETGREIVGPTFVELLDGRTAASGACFGLVRDFEVLGAGLSLWLLLFMEAL